MQYMLMFYETADDFASRGDQRATEYWAGWRAYVRALSESGIVRAGSGLQPGAMTMVDAARSDEIYAEMGPATEISGGSAANTAAGVACFGGKAAYIGRVADDAFGKVFSHDLRSVGVHFEAPFATDGSPITFIVR